LVIQRLFSPGFTPSHIKGIRRFRELAGDRVAESYFVFNGSDRGTVDDVGMVGFDDIGRFT
jgi:hypothetical protein